MNPWQRWLRFNLVGALGAGVQLTALAIFSRLLGGHYLLATGLAVELTLLHNFLWHRRVTWADRREAGSTRRQLLRFHLANGMVSLPGNLVLVRVFVASLHLPLLVANGGAILCCSLVNFAVSHGWTFAAGEKTSGGASVVVEMTRG